MTKIFGVYTHARPNGIVFYVGKGTRDRSSPKGRRTAWHKHVVDKYGHENIKVRFYACSSEVNAFKRERKMIKNYRNNGIVLVNITDGGEGAAGRILTKGQRDQIRDKLKGRSRPAHVKEKLSKSAKKAWKTSREKYLAALRKAAKDPKVREKRKQIALENWKDPERRKKFGKFMKKQWGTKKFRNSQIAKFTKASKRKEVREARIKLGLELWQRPEFRRKMARGHSKET